MNLNIIEALKSILKEFPRIKEFVGEINIDFSDDKTESYGLSPTGDTLISTDILGNETHIHNFVLYSVFQSMNDFDRLSNSGLLLELQYWLSEQGKKNQSVSISVGDNVYNGNIKEISASNGILYEIPNENFQNLCRYQLQIAVTYIINKEWI